MEHLGLIRGIGIALVIVGILLVFLLVAAAIAPPDPRESRIKKKSLREHQEGQEALNDQRDW